jgi:ElaA protein
VPAAPTLHAATFAELDAATLYALLRLRVDVFVVEQRCPYPELDGRDTEPSTSHMWLERDGGPVGYLRLLSEPDGSARIGRVAVAGPARGAGLAGRLMAAALARVDDRECVLDAQSPLVGFYARLGFIPTGPEYLEDGIPHVPMRRTAVSAHPRRPM